MKSTITHYQHTNGNSILTTKRGTEHAHKIKTPSGVPKSLPVSANHSPHDIQLNTQNIIYLQRTIGNQSVGKLILARMKINQPGDEYEKEADQVANEVMRMDDKKIQRQENNKKDELLKSKSGYIQLQTDEKDKTLQKSSLQMQMGEEEDMIQEKSISNQSEDEEKAIVKKSSLPQVQDENLEKQKPVMPARENNSHYSSTNFGNRLSISKGSGFPIPDKTLSFMESRFGSNFNNIKLHTDDESVQMNQELGAQAFTHGSHIYFNAGKYNPDTSEGKRLLAHELTHTMQQGGMIGKMVQRKGHETEDKITATTAAHTQNLSTGVMDEANNTLTFDRLAIPPMKFDIYQNNITRSPGLYQRTVPMGKPQQDWKSAFGGGALTTGSNALGQIIRHGATGPRTNEASNVVLNGQYVFKAVGTRGLQNKNRYIIGTLPQCVTELASPTWDKNGSPKRFDVDHIRELQLGGVDNPSNMQLLRSDLNRYSGIRIHNNILGKIRSHLDSKRIPRSNANVDAIYERYTVIFQQGIEDRHPWFQNFNRDADIWRSDQIQSGVQFQVSNLQSLIEVSNFGSMGNTREFFLFPQAAGLYPMRFRNSPHIYTEERRWLLPWVITSKTLVQEDGDQVLTGFTYELPEKSQRPGRKRMQPFEHQPEQPMNITRYPGAKFAGYIDKNEIVNRGLQFRIMSPIQLNSFDISPEEGIVARGKISPSIPLVRNADIDVVINGDDISFEKVFNIGEIKVPPPLAVKDSNLTVFYSTERGFGVEGRADFEIQNLGQGYIGSAASSTGGFELEGGFNFDSELFDLAEINIWYRNHALGGRGVIAITDPAKIKGIRSARITAQFNEGTFSAEGTVAPNIPGIQEASLNVNYSEKEGLIIGGTLQLASNIPGIRSGSMEVVVRKTASEDQYKVAAQGRAEPNIPGLNTTLTIGYNDGIILIEGHAAYNRGMLGGQIDIGVTNQPIGDNEQPTGQSTEDFRVYGGGNLTLRLTPWLEATAGVRLTPVGEIEVSGAIGLPSAVEIFPRKSINTTIFRMPTLEIPLFAIPLGPRSIGLVATVSGGLTAEAGIGPGQITQLRVAVQYNPAHEENTTITGTGRFVIPADAGLRLYARAGIGLSIGIARVSGNIEVGGGLGLEGAAEANVDVNWSPKSGLELNALGQIYVQPKFKFDVSAVLEASALFLSKEWRHTLAQFEYGPDLRFGIRFPIHYKEGEPFDISLNDVVFDTPQIDIPQLVKGLGKHIID